MTNENTPKVLHQLVIANRILAHHGVLDAFGHVSVRHPEHADRYVMSRSRAPELVTEDDLQTYDLEGRELNGDTRRPYGERFIHAGIFEARPEVQVVCHNHSPSTIPFGVTGVKMRPIFHQAGSIGTDIPVWDVADEFGDTDMLVRDMAMARSLAKMLGPRRMALMRGHGTVVTGKTVPEVVFVAIFMERNAQLSLQAELLAPGKVRYLSDGEARLTDAMNQEPLSSERAWEAWCAQVGLTEE
jgi:ribulose-5-phosphate 4-epimerase/fuculose-1-phosphate aldolase